MVHTPKKKILKKKKTSFIQTFVASQSQSLLFPSVGVTFSCLYIL